MYLTNSCGYANWRKTNQTQRAEPKNTDNVTFGVCGKPFKRRESFGLLAP